MNNELRFNLKKLHDNLTTSENEFFIPIPGEISESDLIWSDLSSENEFSSSPTDDKSYLLSLHDSNLLHFKEMFVSKNINNLQKNPIKFVRKISTGVNDQSKINDQYSIKKYQAFKIIKNKYIQESDDYINLHASGDEKMCADGNPRIQGVDRNSEGPYADQAGPSSEKYPRSQRTAHIPEVHYADRAGQLQNGRGSSAHRENERATEDLRSFLNIRDDNRGRVQMYNESEVMRFNEQRYELYGKGAPRYVSPTPEADKNWQKMEENKKTGNKNGTAQNSGAREVKQYGSGTPISDYESAMKSTRTTVRDRSSSSDSGSGTNRRRIPAKRRSEREQNVGKEDVSKKRNQNQDSFEENNYASKESNYFNEMENPAPGNNYYAQKHQHHAGQNNLEQQNWMEPQYFNNRGRQYRGNRGMAFNHNRGIVPRSRGYKGKPENFIPDFVPGFSRKHEDALNAQFREEDMKRENFIYERNQARQQYRGNAKLHFQTARNEEEGRPMAYQHGNIIKRNIDNNVITRQEDRSKENQDRENSYERRNEKEQMSRKYSQEAKPNVIKVDKKRQERDIYPDTDDSTSKRQCSEPDLFRRDIEVIEESDGSHKTEIEIHTPTLKEKNQIEPEKEKPKNNTVDTICSNMSESHTTKLEDDMQVKDEGPEVVHVDPSNSSINEQVYTAKNILPIHLRLSTTEKATFVERTQHIDSLLDRCLKLVQDEINILTNDHTTPLNSRQQTRLESKQIELKCMESTQGAMRLDLTNYGLYHGQEFTTWLKYISKAIHQEPALEIEKFSVPKTMILGEKTLHYRRFNASLIERLSTDRRSELFLENQDLAVGIEKNKKKMKFKSAADEKLYDRVIKATELSKKLKETSQEQGLGELHQVFDPEKWNQDLQEVSQIELEEESLAIAEEGIKMMGLSIKNLSKSYPATFRANEIYCDFIILAESQHMTSSSTTIPIDNRFQCGYLNEEGRLRPFRKMSKFVRNGNRILSTSSHVHLTTLGTIDKEEQLNNIASLAGRNIGVTVPIEMLLDNNNDGTCSCDDNNINKDVSYIPTICEKLMRTKTHNRLDKVVVDTERTKGEGLNMGLHSYNADGRTLAPNEPGTILNGTPIIRMPLFHHAEQTAVVKGCLRSILDDVQVENYNKEINSREGRLSNYVDVGPEIVEIIRSSGSISRYAASCPFIPGMLNTAHQKKHFDLEEGSYFNVKDLDELKNEMSKDLEEMNSFYCPHCFEISRHSDYVQHYVDVHPHGLALANVGDVINSNERAIQAFLLYCILSTNYRYYPVVTEQKRLGEEQDEKIQSLQLELGKVKESLAVTDKRLRKTKEDYMDFKDYQEDRKDATDKEIHDLKTLVEQMKEEITRSKKEEERTRTELEKITSLSTARGKCIETLRNQNKSLENHRLLDKGINKDLEEEKEKTKKQEQQIKNQICKIINQKKELRFLTRRIDKNEQVIESGFSMLKKFSGCTGTVDNPGEHWPYTSSKEQRSKSIQQRITCKYPKTGDSTSDSSDDNNDEDNKNEEPKIVVGKESRKEPTQDKVKDTREDKGEGAELRRWRDNDVSDEEPKLDKTRDDDWTPKREKKVRATTRGKKN